MDVADLACRVIAAAVLAATALVAPTWPHPAHHWPTVYVENHAGPQWRVPANVHRWASGLHLGHCRPGAGCVLVWAVNQGPNHGYIGTTIYGTDHGHTSEAEIRLNTWCLRRQPSPVLVQAAGHELGHALGLRHDPSGVMAPVDRGGAHITRFEWAELARLYGVTR